MSEEPDAALHGWMPEYLTEGQFRDGESRMMDKAQFGSQHLRRPYHDMGVGRAGER